MSSKKLLILAYAISPTRGSEYSVAWNYISEMSKDNELVVLYGASGLHMGDVEEMEKYISNTSVKNLSFIPILPNKLTSSLNFLNSKGILTYSFYFAYYFWHKQVYEIAKKLINKENFDLIHYLNPIGYREPGFLWKFDLPYMWGPIGGAVNLPIELLQSLSFAGKVKLLFRASVNYFQLRYKSSLRKALKRTDLLLTATTENQKIFYKIHNKFSVYIPENCIRVNLNVRDSKFTERGLLHFVWIGSIENRKALIILLESLILIKNRNNFIIDIIGDGPLRRELEEFSKKNNISDCLKWHGNIPREEVINLLSGSVLNIITSVSEGNPTTIWEAMSVGVPTMTIDHCGMHDVVCSKCGVKIPINSYSKIIRDFAIEIQGLITHPTKFKELSDGVIECSHHFKWEQRRIFFNKMYDKTIKEWQQKRSI